MKKLLLAYIFLCACALATAQLRFDYNVSSETLFDNRECGASTGAYTNSTTIFGTNLLAEIGFSAVSGDEDNGREIRHLFMAGVDLLKDFGSNQSFQEVLKDVTIYYNLEKQLSPKCRFSLTSGIFPRTYSQEDYSEVFYSDSLRFYDPSYEGLLLRFEQPRSAFELGVDWTGQLGEGNRERFMVFSAGHGDVLPWLKLGYSAYMYHYANSYEVQGVVDNAVVNPYVKFDLAPYLPMQELSARLGYILSYQWDRLNMSSAATPMGGELVCEARKWNVSLKNTLYWGQDLMPLYNEADAGGYKYGNSLYFGDPHYRVRTDGGAGTVDCLELFWEPQLAPGLTLRVGAKAYFNEGFSDWNQVVSVRFDLYRLREHLAAKKSLAR